MQQPVNTRQNTAMSYSNNILFSMKKSFQSLGLVAYYALVMAAVLLTNKLHSNEVKVDSLKTELLNESISDSTKVEIFF